MKLMTKSGEFVLKAILIVSAAFALASCKEKGPLEFKADDTTVVNIGTVKEADGPVEFTILYYNATPDTLVAAQSRSSCRCTTPRVNNRPVPPGEYQSIPVKYNPSYQKGAVDEQVDIRYTDGTIRSFPFIANVVPMKHPVTDHARYAMGRDFYSSHKVLSFGLMEPGETKEMYFSIGNDTPRKMKVAFELDGKYAGNVAMRSRVVMPRDGRDTVHVRFTMPDLPSGDTLQVKILPVIGSAPAEQALTLKAKSR